MKRLVSAWTTSGWKEMHEPKAGSLKAGSLKWLWESGDTVYFEVKEEEEINDRNLRKAIREMRDIIPLLGSTVFDPAVPLAVALAFIKLEDKVCTLTFESEEGERLMAASYPPLEMILHKAKFWSKLPADGSANSEFGTRPMSIRNEKYIGKLKSVWPRDWKQLSPLSLTSSKTPCEKRYVVSMDYPEDITKLRRVVNQVFEENQFPHPSRSAYEDPGMPVKELRLVMGTKGAEDEVKRARLEHSWKLFLLEEATAKHDSLKDTFVRTKKALMKTLKKIVKAEEKILIAQEWAEEELKISETKEKLLEEELEAAKNVEEQGARRGAIKRLRM